MRYVPSGMAVVRTAERAACLGLPETHRGFEVGTVNPVNVRVCELPSGRRAFMGAFRGKGPPTTKRELSPLAPAEKTSPVEMRRRRGL
jgi:hypothetical protein